MSISLEERARVATKLTKARATLLIEQPFYGTLALRLHLVETDEIDTLAVDGHSIFYNPKFCEDLPVDQLRTAVAHEVGHCVFDHVGRRGPRDPMKWNLAGDHVINLGLEEASFTKIPGYWNADKKFTGMSADQVYNLLPDGAGSDGTGGDGRGQKVLDDIMNGPGGKAMDESERTVIENDWKVATLQAANLAKQQGKLPASLERFIKEMTEAKVNWRDQLRNLITERAKNDYCWSRPNRRFAGQGLFLPSMYSETMGTIVVVTDDSGSIGNDMLAAFEAEIKAIRSAVMPLKTIHISCDARINHVAEFAMEDEFKVVSKGGGGTDFNPPFEHIEREGEKPVCLVYLTDLYGPAPNVPPDYPVIWCCTTDKVGPWGETIHVEV